MTVELETPVDVEWRRTTWFVGLIGATVNLMLLTHELGHVLAAWLTGGTVVRTNLLPWVLPYTLVIPNPAPQGVAWGGMIFGGGLPLIVWLISRFYASAKSVGFAWVAGGCLLANGCYLTFGGHESLTDTGQLRSLGWPEWLLGAIGLAIAIPGYALSRTATISLSQQVTKGQIHWRHIGQLWGGWIVGFIGQALMASLYGATG